MKGLNALLNLIDGINEWIGRLVSWLTLAMVIVTFAVVVLRYGFNLGWIAMQESITYMHATVFLLGIAYTLKHDEHVRVDIFYRDSSPRAKAWVDMIGSLFILLPVSLFTLIVCWEYVAESWNLLEGSREPGGLPGVFLVKSLILCMASLLTLQGLAEVIRCARVLCGLTDENTGSASS